MAGKLSVVSLLLIGGGIVIIGYGAWTIWGGGLNGGTGPRFTVRPNPVRASDRADLPMTFDVRGFPPNEDILGYFARDNGIRIGSDHIRMPVDANGSLIYLPCSVDSARTAAATNGGGYVNYRIQGMGPLGLGAKIRIDVEGTALSFGFSQFDDRILTP